MKLLWLAMLAAAPCAGQFLSMEMTLQGIGCVTCIESLPERMKRIRGVESATLDAEHGTLKLKLAEPNRVRLEQVRDAIEQDGTKVSKAMVEVKGELSRQDGRWLLQPAGVSSSYRVEGVGAEVAAGTYVVDGEVAKLRPEDAQIVIRASEVIKK